MTTHLLVMDSSVHLLCPYQPLSPESPMRSIPISFLCQVLGSSIHYLAPVTFTNLVASPKWHWAEVGDQVLSPSWQTSFITASGQVRKCCGNKYEQNVGAFTSSSLLLAHPVEWDSAIQSGSIWQHPDPETWFWDVQGRWWMYRKLSVVSYVLQPGSDVQLRPLGQN